jgi:glycerol-3-phosphate acyltransferase PlsX
MGHSFMSRIGYLFARSAFKRLGEKMDPRKVNGGVFLGLNGVVIKSHGGTDSEGFAAALDMGHDMVRNELQSKIDIDIKKFHTRQGRSRSANSASEQSENKSEK